MELPAASRSMWRAYQGELGDDISDRFYEVFHFDDNEQDADLLADLVLQGVKRATAGLLWSFEADNKPPPNPGDFSIVTNWRSEPQCIIETMRIETVPFEEVTERFAAIEGEGDKTLQYWRKVHWSYFGRECQRLGKSPSLTMPVVCEEFRVVFPVDLAVESNEE